MSVFVFANAAPLCTICNWSVFPVFFFRNHASANLFGARCIVCWCRRIRFAHALPTEFPEGPMFEPFGSGTAGSWFEPSRPGPKKQRLPGRSPAGLCFPRCRRPCNVWVPQLRSLRDMMALTGLILLSDKLVQEKGLFLERIASGANPHVAWPIQERQLK